MFLADVKKAYFAALDKLPERELLLAKKEHYLDHLISENIFLKQELEEAREEIDNLETAARLSQNLLAAIDFIDKQNQKLYKQED